MGLAFRLDLVVAAGGALIASSFVFRSRDHEFSFENLVVGCGLTLGFGGLIYAMLEVVEPSELMQYVRPEQLWIVIILAIFTVFSAGLALQRKGNHYVEASISVGLAAAAVGVAIGAGKAWTTSPLYDWALAAIVLSGLVLAYRMEASNRSRGVFFVTSLLIAVELIVVYFKTLGSYLSTSAFFLGCGLLLAGFATALLLVERQRAMA
jgi:hypothetical protein